jgi:VWFA-related protein
VPDQIRGRRTGEGQPQNALLRDLAENTGGRLWEASSRQLTETFVKVLEDIRTRYVLTYSPTGVATGGWHAVQVKLTRGRGDIRARPGYFATPRK